MPFFRGKTGFYLRTEKRNKKKNENKTKQTEKIKEGLGPSGMALWVTSPDP